MRPLLLVLTLIFSLMTPLTHAAKTPTQKTSSSKVKVQVETYPAVENEVEASTPATMTQKITTQSTSISYDMVPKNQLNPIAKRLKLVEKLILVHGRAYDYRKLTLKQLEQILKKLEAESAMFAPPVQTKAEADEAATTRPLEEDESFEE